MRRHVFLLSLIIALLSFQFVSAEEVSDLNEENNELKIFSKNVDNDILDEEEIEDIIEKHYSMIEKEETAKAEENIKFSNDLQKYADFIALKNSNVPAEQREKIAQCVKKAAEKYDVRSSLLMAIIWQESTFRTNCSSGACHGLMQLHSKYCGLSMDEIFDIEKNIMEGANELSRDYSLYGTDIMALTAYNQGTGNVNRGNYNTKYASRVLAKEQQILQYLNN